MNWRSATFRFAALVFLCQLVAAVALLAGLGTILQRQSSARAQAVVADFRDDLLATYARGGARALADEIGVRRTEAVVPGAVMLLVDRAGRVLAGNLAGWPAEVSSESDHAEVELYRVGHLTPEAMVLRATRLPDGERLLTGLVIEDERRLFALLGRVSALALVMALALAIAAAWLTARLIAARLGSTVATLGAVRAGDIARRVPQDGSGDAFAALGQQVNYTLDRVESLIGELKIATDSLAHDLKSPLTRLSVALERTVGAPDEAAVRAEAERAMGEVEHLHALVETALSISRAEAGMGRESFGEVDLAGMLQTIAEIYGPLAEDQGRTIVVDAPVPMPWQVHRQLLGQAIGNLIDNAIKYGAGAISLSLRAADGGAVVAVADRGPGIPAGQRAEALRRFGRLDSARGGTGAGLGLALVQAVATLHGGDVALDDAAPGLVVTIRLA